jgi:hypothetical protein
VPGHRGREWSARRKRSRLHRRRTGRKLTRLLTRVAGRHAACDTRPVKPGRTLPARTADYGNLTRAREATAAVLAAIERPRSLRPRPLPPWSVWPRPLRPWKLPGELLSGELLSGKLRLRDLRSRKLRSRKLRRWELRRGAERPRMRLFGERSAAWTSGAGLRCAGLSWAHLAVAGKPSGGVLTAAARCSFIWRAAVRPSAGGRSRVWRSRLRTTGPPAAVLVAAVLPTDLRRAALRPPGKLARGLRRRMLGRRLLGRVRPGGWRELGTARDRALRPGTGGRRGLPARSVAIGAVAISATVPRSRSPGRLASETGPAGESAGRGPGTAGRDRSAAHAVVTRTPAQPRTPIPRTFVPRQTGIASWTGAPADPGVGISPAFIIRPVFGARPPTPAPPPREPCHIIDRRHPGDL